VSLLAEYSQRRAPGAKSNLPIRKPAKPSVLPECRVRPGYETPTISAGGGRVTSKLAWFCSAPMAWFYSAVHSFADENEFLRASRFPRLLSGLFNHEKSFCGRDHRWTPGDIKSQ
jgi:hypothetical protein